MYTITNTSNGKMRTIHFKAATLAQALRIASALGFTVLVRR